MDSLAYNVNSVCKTWSLDRGGNGTRSQENGEDDLLEAALHEVPRGGVNCPRKELRLLVRPVDCSRCGLGDNLGVAHALPFHSPSSNTPNTSMIYHPSTSRRVFLERF
jgi:hypothetical protein